MKGFRLSITLCACAAAMLATLGSSATRAQAQAQAPSAVDYGLTTDIAPGEKRRVVIFGDSIAHRLTQQNLIYSDDRYIDVEPGRSLWSPGIFNRSTYGEAWPQVLARSMAGGWIVFVDDGTRATDGEWAAFMQKIADDTPDDRCLLAVSTKIVYGVNAPYSAARMATMRAKFAQQPCHRHVRWDLSVSVPGRDWLEDEVHPNAEGQRNLAMMIDRAVGYRRVTP